MSVDLQPDSAPRLRAVVSISMVLIGIAICLVLIRWSLLLKSPAVAYLAEEPSAPWICLERPFDLMANSVMRTGTMFRHEFRLDHTVATAHLRIRAFRNYSIWLDKEFEKNPPFFKSPSNLGAWKNPEEISLPGPLHAGDHFLSIYVENRGAPACLSAECSEIDMHTNLDWQVCNSDGSRSSVRLASSAPILDLPTRYPTVAASVWSLSPILVSIFLATFLISVFESRLPIQTLTTPTIIRYGLLGIWLVLCVNNVIKVPGWLGFDLPGHLEYIQYIAQRHQLPLANEGWTMFQSPLFYLVAAPFYSVFAQFFDLETTVRLLRSIPMLCGMFQIEITFRVARRIYPECLEQQSVATVIGGLVPMNVYSSQYIGNEPLAGVLTSLTILLVLPLVKAPGEPRKWAYFVILGVVWGLALLSKVSPILLAPLLLLVIAFRGWTNRNPLSQTVVEISTVIGSAFVVCGWYYVRNLIYLGRFFVGGWDQHRQVNWWQDPGYRTWTQLTSMGTSFVQPVYSGYWSLPDALFSTLFCDGFLSGTVVTPEQIPWNVAWLESLSWLGLFPLSCMLLGGLSCFRQSSLSQRSCLIFCSAVIGIYLSAIVDLWFQLPIYSTAKSSYMLGVMPCLGVLAASGSSPLLRTIWGRALLRASLTCSAVSVVVAFFCVKQP